MNRNESSGMSIGLDGNERRAAVLRAEQERAEERHSKLQALTAPFAAPSERIRLWEELYGLALPATADHRLVRVIATRTSLSVQQVHDEQQRRADARFV